MAEPSIIERIRGRSFETGGDQPFLLDNPEHVYYVEKGCLDIFAVELHNQKPVDRRPFITRIPTDGMAFGTPIFAAPGQVNQARALLAVPSRDTVIIKGEREGISADSFDIASTIWVDAWIIRLSEFMARGKYTPRNAMLLEAEPNVPYPAGSSLSAQHSDTIWVSANKPVRFIGHQDMIVVPEDPALPLSERVWVDLDMDTEVSAVYTPTVLIKNQLWPAFDRFGTRTLEFSNIAMAEATQSLQQRRRDASKARHTITGRVFQHLDSTLGSGRDKIAPAGAKIATPLRAAVNLIAEFHGVSLDLPNVSQGKGKNESLESLMHASNARTRPIALTPGWHRRDGPAFIGFTTETRQPLCLLPDGRGTYHAVNPETGTDLPVGNQETTKLQHTGMMLYMPFPDRVKDGKNALLHAFRKHGRDIMTVLGMAVLGALVALLLPILTGHLLVDIIPRVDTAQWIAALAALTLAAFGTVTFDIVRTFAQLRIEGRVDERLQAAIWSRLISLPAPFFRNFTAGDLADRANGIGVIRQLLTGATANAVIGGMFSIFSFALLFYYSWSLALCAAGLVLVLVGITWIFTRGQMRHHRIAFRIQGMLDGLIFQMITGLSKLRVANAECYALLRWAEQYSRQKKETLSARYWAAGQHAVNSLFMPMALLGLFAFIWYMLLEGETQPSFDLLAFLSFNAAFGQFAAAVIGLTSAWTTVASVIPLFERVQPILEAQPETTTSGIDPQDLSGEVEFADVTFRYLPEGPDAVKEVSFHIHPGDYVAFVGPSGSGKSTVYRLLLGFEQPDSGTVFLDGYDLASLNLPAARRHMGVVLQNGQLVPGSIFENIAGSSTLTMDEAWAAVRAAGLEEDIRSMPMGLHTVLSEGAVGLSGGQKQRLLIARALAHKPRILLFDEATSALDNRTQLLVQTSLEKLSVTRVVIAHRISTIRNVDLIYVLEEGRIVESGTYDDLMEKNGAFTALAKRQLI